MSVPLHDVVVALVHEAADVIELERCKPPGGGIMRRAAEFSRSISRKKNCETVYKWTDTCLDNVQDSVRQLTRLVDLAVHHVLRTRQCVGIPWARVEVSRSKDRKVRRSCLSFRFY